jgi:glycosyltransferase involved in cell wall biosynthesis
MSTSFAYLLKKFPRLSETFILNELLGQERLGRPIQVLSRRHPDDEPRHPALERLQAEVEVLPPIRALDPWSTIFAGGSARQPLLGRVERLIGEWDAWCHPRLPSLLTESLYLLRRTADLGIRHLHVHFASDAAIVAMLLRDLGGPTYSLTAHAKDIYREGVNYALLDRIVGRSEFTVTVCEANVRYLEQRLSDAALSRLRCLYNGIDLGHFSDQSKERKPREILSVGRLVEKKGFDVLLETLRLLAERGQRFEATIVGDGELRPELEARSAELGLAGRVRFTGAVDQGEVRRLMARATLFCLPCTVGEDGNRDALPTVLLEALASGLPVISTPVSGVPEIVDEGRAGVLVPERDPLATAAAVERLLDRPAEREQLAAAGRHRAGLHFDLRKSARTLFDWFEEATDEGSGTCARPA